MVDLIEKKLRLIYKEEYQNQYLEKMKNMLDKYKPKLDVGKLDHTTAYMITYGDIVENKNEPTIEVLNRFVKKAL